MPAAALTFEPRAALSTGGWTEPGPGGGCGGVWRVEEEEEEEEEQDGEVFSVPALGIAPASAVCGPLPGTGEAAPAEADLAELFKLQAAAGLGDTGEFEEADDRPSGELPGAPPAASDCPPAGACVDTVDEVAPALLD